MYIQCQYKNLLKEENMNYRIVFSSGQAFPYPDAWERVDA